MTAPAAKRAAQAAVAALMANVYPNDTSKETRP